jgi:diadenylate cyclase
MHSFSLSWQMFTDLALLSLLVWALYSMLRGTRAFHMLIGMAVIVAIGLFAIRFDLPVIGWIAEHLAPFFVFSFIIIFQGEIRRLLARLGRFVTLTSGAGKADTYEQLVVGAEFFAKVRIGALMVIERDIGLRTFIESGVPLDAEISFDLLASIFPPKAPLHDGAVIIRGNRIAAASCFLPLSLNPALTTQMGTRHRAAIGITEETDAIAIVVSEETGQISVAVSGRVDRGLTADELRRRLSTLITHKPTLNPKAAVDEEAEPEPTFQRSDSEG